MNGAGRRIEVITIIAKEGQEVLYKSQGFTHQDKQRAD